MRGGVGDYRIGTVEPFLVAFTAELQEFNETEVELCNGGFLSAIGGRCWGIAQRSYGRQGELDS